jgi:hypothetical protein
MNVKTTSSLTGIALLGAVLLTGCSAGSFADADEAKAKILTAGFPCEDSHIETPDGGEAVETLSCSYDGADGNTEYYGVVVANNAENLQLSMTSACTELRNGDMEDSAILVGSNWALLALKAGGSPSLNDFKDSLGGDISTIGGYCE